VASPDFCRIGDLTHFLAYQLDALIDLGRPELAQPALDQLAIAQGADGGVRGIGGASWVCSTGLAQLAICWYKTGQHAPADAAMRWIERHQESSGGFRGSYGSGASYKQDTEISWAVKFALDAHLLRVQAFFARFAGDFPAEVPVADGRAQAVLAHVADGDRVLEVGCGKGRFLNAVAASRRRVECHGVDPSAALLASAPPGIETRQGTLERIPHPDASFDVVFSVEAIEHSVAWDRAVEELTRVAKPGGWVVIIDRHAGASGRIECPSWARWPDKDTLASALRVECDGVTVVPVAYDRHPASDGLMVAWSGRKRTRLSGDEWNAVLGVSELEQSVANEVRFHHFSDWGRAMLRQTAPGDRVLEIGSGTGKISLQLALTGRRVTCLDTSPDSLAFVSRVAAAVGVSVTTQLTDATGGLPFADGAFECVWSSGLLEHFTSAERVVMLKEWARVCRGRMVHLVPNAAALAYRYGKSVQERRGDWPYGLEMPIATLRDDYAAAGIRVTSEFTVAPEHGLNFIHDGASRKAFSDALASVPRRALHDWQQGYLLVTVGEVAR
jgi:ubiquinone/menaquinone biosynthesis C-methylase UbiE